MLDPSGFCDGFYGLGWMIFSRVIVIDDGLELVDRFRVFYVLDFLHVPGQLQQERNLQDKQDSILLVPQLNDPILRDGQNGNNVKINFSPNDYLFLMRL